ncbi:MAG: hypothetical protein RL368_2471 [Pseudomonadota bacterium]
MYDVLNRIAVDSHLGKARDYEYASSFRQTRAMLKGEGANSQQYNLQPHSSKCHAIKLAGLPTAIPVRFVRVPYD